MSHEDNYPLVLLCRDATGIMEHSFESHRKTWPSFCPLMASTGKEGAKGL